MTTEKERELAEAARLMTDHAELTFGSRKVFTTPGGCKTDNGDVQVRDRRVPGEYMRPERYQAHYRDSNDNGFCAKTKQGALDMLLADLKAKRERLDVALGRQQERLD